MRVMLMVTVHLVEVRHALRGVIEPLDRLKRVVRPGALLDAREEGAAFAELLQQLWRRRVRAIIGLLLCAAVAPGHAPRRQQRAARWRRVGCAATTVVASTRQHCGGAAT